MKKMSKNDVRFFLQHIWRDCIRPIHDGEFSVYDETIDGENYVYLDVKGLGVMEELTLQWIVSEQEGLHQERGYVGEVATLEQHIPYNTLILNPWDCYDGSEAEKYRKKYVAIMAMVLARGYDQAVPVKVFLDDDFSYGLSLAEAICQLAQRLKEED